MKKLVGIFLALTLLAGLITAVPALAAGENLLTNPGFQDANKERTFDGWTGQNGFNVTDHLVAISTGGARINLKTAGVYFFQWVNNVEAGKTYELSFQYHCAVDGRMEMIPAVYNDEGNILYPYIYFPATANMTTVTYRMTIPEGGTRLQFTMRANKNVGEETVDLLIDDTAVRLVDGGENLEFEDQLTGWAVTGTAAADENAHDGVFSAKVSSGGTLKKIVMLDENTNDISAYVKTTGSATATLTATPLWNGSWSLDSQTLSVSSNTWKKTEFGTISYTTDASRVYPVMLELAVTGEGEACFDDFAVDSFTNLVPNGGFEDGATSWTKQQGKNTAATTLATYIVSEGTAVANGGVASAYEGSKFVEMTATNSGTKISGTKVGEYVILKSADIPLTAGKQYELSFVANTNSSRAQVMLYYYNGTAELSPFLNINPVNNTSGAWRKHSIVFTVPETATHAVVQLRESSDMFASTVAFNQYDAVCVREMPEYAGFYSTTAMYGYPQYLTGIASWLGQKQETLTADTEYTFRFDSETRSSDTTLAAISLYARDGEGRKKLVKLYGLETLTRQGYTTESGYDMGFQMKATVAAADIADTSLEYTLEAYAWEADGSLKPIMKKTIIN